MSLADGLQRKIRDFAHDAHEQAVTYRCGITIWWDREHGEWHLIPAHDGVAKALLAAIDHMQSPLLRLYVGTYKAPCTEYEIRQDLLAHAVGRLVI